MKQKIADNIRNAEFFTIISDGTTDKNRKQFQGFVCRYLADNNIEEHCLSVKGINNCSAKETFGFIKDTLEEFKISKDDLLSQS